MLVSGDYLQTHDYHCDAMQSNNLSVSVATCGVFCPASGECIRDTLCDYPNSVEFHFVICPTPSCALCEPFEKALEAS